MSVPEDQLPNELSTHHPSRRAALSALMQGELTKGELAFQVFKRRDSSARAMTTRLTFVLANLGLVTERPSGRERHVSLTENGQALVRKWEQELQRKHRARGLPEALSSSDPHRDDRPRAHLRHAAMLALASLKELGGSQNTADEHYEQILIALIDEKNGPTEDLEHYYWLQRSWPKSDQARMLLVESLVRFENDRERSRVASEFVSWVDLASGRSNAPSAAEKVLWASGAVDIAHQLLLEPESPLDRITARSLLFRSMEWMREVGASQPMFKVAALYRLAKAAKVAGNYDLTIQMWEETAKSAMVPSPAAEDPLRRKIASVEKEVCRAAEFNLTFEPFEAVLVRRIGPWVMRALPSSETIFRKVGGVGFSDEVQSWALSVQGRLCDIVLTSAHKDGELRSTARDLSTSLQKFRNERFWSVIQPHMLQAEALDGGPSTRSHVGPALPPYNKLIRNNFWSPETVVLDIVARSEIGKATSYVDE